MSNISENLKNLRKEKGWTQQELADKLFVTRQAVSNWELGKTEPDVDMIIKISEITQNNIDTLISTDRQQTTSLAKREQSSDRILIAYIILLVIFLVAKDICIYATETAKYSGLVTDSIRAKLDMAETVRKLTLPWYAVSLGLVNFLFGAVATRIIKSRLKSSKFNRIKHFIHVLCLAVISLHCTLYFTGWCSSAAILSLHSILETVTSPFNAIKKILYTATMLQQYRWQFIPFGAIYEYTRQTKTEC